MNESEILTAIDNLIQQLKRSNVEPTDEVLSLVNDISAAIVERNKARKKEEYDQSLIDKLDSLVRATIDNKTISDTIAGNLVAAIEKIKIDSPQVTVTTPEVRVPAIAVPPAQVSFPDEVDIKKPSWLQGIFSLTALTEQIREVQQELITHRLPTDPKKPVAVRLSDGSSFYKAMGSLMSAISQLFPFVDAQGREKQALVDDDGRLMVSANATIPDGLATEATLLAILAKINAPIDNETPGGTVDGVNEDFTTLYSYQPGSTKLFLNGLRQQEGLGFDYIENGTNEIQFNAAPLNGDLLLVDYAKL